MTFESVPTPPEGRSQSADAERSDIRRVIMSSSHRGSIDCGHGLGHILRGMLDAAKNRARIAIFGDLRRVQRVLLTGNPYRPERRVSANSVHAMYFSKAALDLFHVCWGRDKGNIAGQCWSLNYPLLNAAFLPEPLPGFRSYPESDN